MKGSSLLAAGVALGLIGSAAPPVRYLPGAPSVKHRPRTFKAGLKGQTSKAKRRNPFKPWDQARLDGGNARAMTAHEGGLPHG